MTQEESLLTTARKLSKEHAALDLAQCAGQCRNRTHGLNPWPGVVVECEGDPLKLLRAEAIDPDPESERSPGQITDLERGLVACEGSSILRLIEVQPAGKRAMPWADFARGRALAPGARLIGRSDPAC